MDILFGRNQFPVIVSFFVCGIICGIIFDLFKIKRRIFGSPYIVLFFDDILFMLLVAVITIFNAYAFNNGNMKWYEVPDMILGFLVYRKTISVFFIKICFFIIDKIKQILFRLFIPIKKVLIKFTVIYKNIILVLYTYKSRRLFVSYRI